MSEIKIEKRSWEEFHQTRLLWWINRTLRLFGWSIVLVVQDEKVVDVYPAKTNATSFPEDFEKTAFKELQEYIRGED